MVAISDREPCSRDEVLYIWIMDPAALLENPPPPTLVVTPWSGSRGQDLLGLRAPAERIANDLMDGVTTISPLVRYLSFRSWVIHRYTELRGPNRRAEFYAFAGKCEAALVMGHKVAGEPTTFLIGSREAGKEALAGGPLSVRKLTANLAVDAYSGPSQDLSIGIPIAPVPGLSKERGVPLAEAAGQILDDQPALARIEVSTEPQPLSREEAIALAAAFPMRAPLGRERDLLVDAVCPPSPRPNEFARLAAYCHLLHLAGEAGGRAIREADVFRSAIIGDDDAPPPLRGVADGWLRFLVRDLLAAVHERAVAVVLDMLQESPQFTQNVEGIVRRLADLDTAQAYGPLGLPPLGPGRPISELVDAVRERCAPDRERSGLARWPGDLDEASLMDALAACPGPEALALLPVAWILASERARPGLGDPALSVDARSGAALGRLGLAEFVAPAVRRWRGNGERIGDVVGALARRSVDQHLSIAWYRMQADPSRNVSLIVSDGSSWTAVRPLGPGRATSRLYQAIHWLEQLGLADAGGTTADGRAVLERGLKSLEARRPLP